MIDTTSGARSVLANASEYLVSHGKSGGFGRFTAVVPLSCRRGDRVVVRSGRGLEMGSVLCAATDQHVRLQPQLAGELLRLATVEDEETERRWQADGQRLFEDSRRLAVELALPLEVLDVELLLDGRQLIIQHLAWADYNPGALAEALARRYGLTVQLENLAVPAAAAEEEGGCGEPGCGRAAGGGCTSCGSGGGCASCGGDKIDMRAYFAHLRSKMEQHSPRTPLL